MRILTVVLTSALSVCAVAEATDEQEGRPGTPASVFLGQLDGVDLNDPLAVFGSVLTHLNREVVIYPTENYLYLRFFVGDQEFWGNIRLAVQERDHGLVHFTYYAFGNDLTSTQRLQRSRMLDRDAGVEVIKIDDFRYLVRFGNTEVTFLLNRVDQSPPALFRLAPSERVLFRLHDESNYRFFLIFDRETNALYYVLDEEYAPLIEEEWLNERVVIDPQSGFAFYVDAEQQERKILLGVSAEATRLNTYYDGPFDQLADNYIDESTGLAEAIQSAHPQYRNKIDRYGHIKDGTGTRVAIAPFLMYDTEADLLKRVTPCEEVSDHAVRLSCVTKEMPPPEQGYFLGTPSQVGAFGLVGSIGSPGKLGTAGLPGPIGPFIVAATVGVLGQLHDDLTDTTLMHIAETSGDRFSSGDAQGPPPDSTLVHFSPTSWRHYSGGEAQDIPDTTIAHLPDTSWRHFEGGLDQPAPDTQLLHFSDTTWRHLSGGEDQPVPDTSNAHLPGTTWRHFDGGEPGPVPDTTNVHVSDTTWRHISGGEPQEIPDTSITHVPDTSWRHISGGEDEPVPDTTVIHVSDTTWRHISGGADQPVPDSSIAHVTDTTWRHISGGEDQPVPDSSIAHVTDTTWAHFKGGHPQSVPDTSKHHVTGTSWVHFTGGEPDPDPIPTVSEWGLITMTLLLVLAGTVVCRRRHSGAGAG